MKGGSTSNYFLGAHQSPSSAMGEATLELRLSQVCLTLSMNIPASLTIAILTGLQTWKKRSSSHGLDHHHLFIFLSILSTSQGGVILNFMHSFSSSIYFKGIISFFYVLSTTSLQSVRSQLPCCSLLSRGGVRVRRYSRADLPDITSVHLP